METPEPRSRSRGRRRSLLGVVAYVLVPGERRLRAAGHFRRAGFEVLQGLREFVVLQRLPDGEETGRRERIEIQ